MTARCLVDTNILVYAYDNTEPTKQQQAFQLLDELATTARGALSAQVLSEAFVALTRKIRSPLRPEQAYVRIQNYQQSWPVFDLTSLIVLEAARGVVDYQMNFWDSLIWATAKLNQVGLVLSEDFSSGSVLEGVRFVDPFAEDFVLRDILA